MNITLHQPTTIINSSGGITLISAVNLCLLASGTFLMVGLFTGTWKYLSIRASPEHKAHRYISVAHQAALMYAFASLVMAKLAEFSPYSNTITVVAAALALSHFAFAIVAYIIHGIYKTTDNQFRPPHTMGKMPLSKLAVSGIMWGLVVCETLGVGVLFWGFVQTQIL